MNERFIQNLKQLRNQRKVSQANLAKALQLSRSTITKYEKGEREPDFKTLEMLSDFFGVSIDFLLGRTPVNYPLAKQDGGAEDPASAVTEPLNPEYLTDPFTVEALKTLGGSGAILNPDQQRFLLQMIKVYLATVNAEQPNNQG